MTVSIVAFTGKAGAGKSTAASFLHSSLEDQGNTVYRTAFAAPLKECARTFFFWDGQKDVRGRRLLQLLGTEVGRDYSPDVWIRHMKNYIFQCDDPSFVIIDDLRFDNEAQFVHTFPLGYVIDITRHKTNIQKENANHASEKGISSDLLSFKFWNSGNKENLECHMHFLAEELIYNATATFNN